MSILDKSHGHWLRVDAWERSKEYLSNPISFERCPASTAGYDNLITDTSEKV